MCVCVCEREKETERDCTPNNLFFPHPKLPNQELVQSMLQCKQTGCDSAAYVSKLVAVEKSCFPTKAVAAPEISMEERRKRFGDDYDD